MRDTRYVEPEHDEDFWDYSPLATRPDGEYVVEIVYLHGRPNERETLTLLDGTWYRTVNEGGVDDPRLSTVYLESHDKVVDVVKTFDE